MSLSIIESRAVVGTSAPTVTVEVQLSRGLPACSIVGLPETAVKESRDRVRGAIINSGFEFPRQRIIVNLAPADLPKAGGCFDLPIALGILAASSQIKADCLTGYVFLGELALSGALREVPGALIAGLSVQQTKKILVLPEKSAEQAALVSNLDVKSVSSLTEVCLGLNGEDGLVQAMPVEVKVAKTHPDFSDVIGHQFAKRALEICAAGQHSILMTGPPGAGKTMLASRLGSIMPAMSETEALETAAISSISTSGFSIENWKQRPFRSPHHSASGAALAGGGSMPRPGEISLAHNGVLFLDELPEFNRSVLELLREPMESGRINISRAKHQASYLARFLLVATSNPCQCGYYGDDRCICSMEQVNRYRAKLSGPLLDRIDMKLNVQPVPRIEMRSNDIPTETSKDIQQRVVNARQIQIDRQGKLNSMLSTLETKEVCGLTNGQLDLLDQIAERYRLSTRGNHRILKLARTIADVNEKQIVSDDHLLLAVKLRCVA